MTLTPPGRQRESRGGVDVVTKHVRDARGSASHQCCSPNLKTFLKTSINLLTVLCSETHCSVMKCHSWMLSFSTIIHPPSLQTL